MVTEDDWYRIQTTGTPVVPAALEEAPWYCSLWTTGQTPLEHRNLLFIGTTLGGGRFLLAGDKNQLACFSQAGGPNQDHYAESHLQIAACVGTPDQPHVL